MGCLSIMTDPPEGADLSDPALEFDSKRWGDMRLTAICCRCEDEFEVLLEQVNEDDFVLCEYCERTFQSGSTPDPMDRDDD